jgi:hypothetical protein
LVEWNPIGVPSFISEEEYVGYIPAIIAHLNSKEDLFCCLENILINELGLHFDSSSKGEREELFKVCDKLIEAAAS